MPCCPKALIFVRSGNLKDQHHARLGECDAEGDIWETISLEYVGEQGISLHSDYITT